MNNGKYYLKAAKVFTEQKIITQGYVLVENSLIKKIENVPISDVKVIDLGDVNLIPGMIDMHIHGREGCDIMDAKMSSMETISLSLAKYVVVGFLGTTVTANWQQTLDAFKIVGQASKRKMPGAQVLGAYNEGLFYTETHKGAHNEKFFLPLTKDRIDAIYQACQGMLKVIALAPEFEDSTEVIQYLNSLGVKVMLGHTNATYQQAKEALAAGACGGVHIFNGMSGIHHRDPGCAGAVLMNKSALAEVIADGIHLHPTIMQLIYALKGPDKMALISDCINAGGFSDGRYRLGELDVFVKNGVARTKEGSLAGSTLTLNVSVKNLVNMAKIPLLEAINMASLVPAKHLDLENTLGSISVNKRACFAVVDDNFEVQATIIDGQPVYVKQGYKPLSELKFV